MSATHRCTRCREVHDISNFYQKRDARTGLSSWCKPCVKNSVVEKGKRCIECHEKKPLTHFHRDISASDGRNTECRRCQQGHKPKSLMRGSVLWSDPVDFPRIIEHLGVRAVGLNDREKIALWNELTDFVLPRESMKSDPLKIIV